MLDELKKYVDLKEDVTEADLQGYLEGLKKVTPEGVKDFLEKAMASDPTTEERKAIQPILDKYHSKGLESWKEKNLPKIKDEIQKKLNPEETPEQKKLRELEDKLSQSEAERKRERLRNKAIAIVTEKGLTNAMDIVDHFLGQDEDATVANLGKLEKFVQNVKENTTQDIFKGGGRDPHRKKQSAKTQAEQLEAELAKATTNSERIAIKRKLHELQTKKE